MDFSKYQYENVFEIDEIDGKKRNKKVIARLLSKETGKTVFVDVTHLSVPDIFISEGKKTPYKSYLDSNQELSKYSFKTIPEYKKFIKKIKKDVLDENGKVKTKMIEYDGEWIEIDITEFQDNAFGYQNLNHTFIHRYFPDSEESNHAHRTWLIDIETRSEVAYQFDDDYEVEVELV